MAANVTLRMDEEILREVKHRAVDDRMSVSAWVTLLLRRTVGETASAGRANDNVAPNVRKRALQRLEQGFSLGGSPLTREQAHGR